ncbi:MAG: hypothetical protein MUO27_11360 [Sedimentisphaerales bacterium]|nr:hypothetical protein [Sedimentisphaerales bacterium]
MRKGLLAAKLLFVALLAVVFLGGCGDYYETPEQRQRNLEAFRTMNNTFSDMDRQRQERRQDSRMDDMGMDIWRLQH